MLTMLMVGAALAKAPEPPWCGVPYFGHRKLMGMSKLTFLTYEDIVASEAERAATEKRDPVPAPPMWSAGLRIARTSEASADPSLQLLVVQDAGGAGDCAPAAHRDAGQGDGQPGRAVDELLVDRRRGDADLSAHRVRRRWDLAVAVRVDGRRHRCRDAHRAAEEVVGPEPAAVSLTTDPGLEDLAIDELRALVGAGLTFVARARPDDRAGHVAIEAGIAQAALEALALQLKSVHHVVRPLLRFDLPADDPLGHVQRTVASIAPSIPELAPAHVAFRVTSSRSGTHPFTSEDVQRVAGAGVRDVLPRAVRLKGADVELRCDVRGASVLLGVQLTRIALSRRSPGAYRPTTSLRANVAWAMLQLACPDRAPRVLLDPFVGGGTILAEAAARWPDTRLCGSNQQARCVDGVAANLAEAGLASRSTVRVGDARHLDAVWPDERFDAIVTNPPFGHRIGADVDFGALYRAFLAGTADRSTDDARMVVLVSRRGDFNRALRAVNRWETRHVRMIEIGGLYVGLFVLSRA